MRGPEVYVYDTKWLTLHPRDGISCRHKATQLVMRAIGVSHTQLEKMSFDEIFHLTAGVYFHFL